jgi:hypothetical protein
MGGVARGQDVGVAREEHRALQRRPEHLVRVDRKRVRTLRPAHEVPAVEQHEHTQKQCNQQKQKQTALR